MRHRLPPHTLEQAKFRPTSALCAAAGQHGRSAVKPAPYLETADRFTGYWRNDGIHVYGASFEDGHGFLPSCGPCLPVLKTRRNGTA